MASHAEQVKQLRADVISAQDLRHAIWAYNDLRKVAPANAVLAFEEFVRAHYDDKLSEAQLDERDASNFKRGYDLGYGEGRNRGDESGYRRGTLNEQRRSEGQPQLMYASMEQLAEELLTRVRSLEPSQSEVETREREAEQSDEKDDGRSEGDVEWNVYAEPQNVEPIVRVTSGGGYTTIEVRS